MLRDLLELIREGRGYTPAELARQLDTSEGLVLQMLDDLERMGRLTHAILSAARSLFREVVVSPLLG